MSLARMSGQAMRRTHSFKRRQQSSVLSWAFAQACLLWRDKHVRQHALPEAPQEALQPRWQAGPCQPAPCQPCVDVACGVALQCSDQLLSEARAEGMLRA